MAREKEPVVGGAHPLLALPNLINMLGADIAEFCLRYRLQFDRAATNKCEIAQRKVASTAITTK
jgi:hypothetical protein